MKIEDRLGWWQPEFSEAEALAVADVVRGGFVNEGRLTEDFTNQVASTLGVRFVLATCNGTVALFLALRASGVEAGDEVIVPDLTFIATANAVAMSGASPVFADIRPHDLNIDPAKVETLINKRTRAIVAVHINGRSADLDALGAIAKRHGLALIEDAAQALGSRVRGQALGTIADAGSMSLAPTKIISSGQGGLVLTNREDVRDAVVRLKDHGRLSRGWNYHPQVGYNFKYSDIYASIAHIQLRTLEKRIARVKSDFNQYLDGLSASPGIRFLDTDLAGGAVPLWVDALVDDAHGLQQALAVQQIDCRPFWPAIHTQGCYPGAFKCENSSYAAEHGVWFPSGPGKTEQDIDRVIAASKEFLEK